MNKIEVNFLRNLVYWLLDFLKGGNVKRHFRDIKKTIENPRSAYINDKKNILLNKLLNHAVKTTNYYKDYAEFKSLLSFPVVNKNIIRDNPDGFYSSKYKSNQVILVSTSGSTGAPFTLRINKDKRKRNTADTLYFLKRCGYKIGHIVIYIKIWEKHQKYSLFSNFGIKNIYPQSVFNLSDKEIKQLISFIENNKCKVFIISYSSSLEKICKYLDSINSNKIDANVVSVIATSEALNPYTKQAIKKYFGVEAVSRYSNNENGILAHQDKSSNDKFIINQASYHIEILDINSDNAVASGVLGRIVVTDLYNYAMPFIRYDSGDLGIMEYDENNNPVLSLVKGRKLDAIYDTSGEIVPSHVSYKLCKYGDYKQFQLIQYGEKEYEIKLNIDKKVDEEAVIKEFKGYFGENAIITIKYVNEIPLLASGKRQEVLNTYYPKIK